MADVRIETKGLKCPMPIVEVAKAVKTLTSGKTLEVVAYDPAFGEDIKAWCKMTGHILVSLAVSKESVFTAVIEVK